MLDSKFRKVVLDIFRPICVLLFIADIGNLKVFLPFLILREYVHVRFAPYGLPHFSLYIIIVETSLESLPVSL